jgi:hypothetical protein
MKTYLLIAAKPIHYLNLQSKYLKMKKIKLGIIGFLLCVFPAILKSQSIYQLGQWNNNANFVIEYYQDRVITSTTSGITFMNVSDPFNPTPSATLGNPGSFPMAIAIDSSYAFFGGGMTGYFMIANISNINFPVQTGITYGISGTAYQIAIKGNYAFMPTNTDTLYSIDISNKNFPVVVDKIDLGSFSSGIAINGNYAYAGTSGGLKIVDITNPSNMNVVSSFGGGYDKISPDLPNNRLFVSKSGQGFDVIDISNPINPSGLFQGIGGNSAGDLVYKNGYVFQIGSDNVSAFQIGLSSATYIASFNNTITGQVNAVSAKDSVFYLSTVNNLHVLKLGSTSSGISDDLSQTHISYPNPSQNTITVECNLISPNSTVLIYDHSGH